MQLDMRLSLLCVFLVGNGLSSLGATGKRLNVFHDDSFRRASQNGILIEEVLRSLGFSNNLSVTFTARDSRNNLAFEEGDSIIQIGRCKMLKEMMWFASSKAPYVQVNRISILTSKDCDSNIDSKAIPLYLALESRKIPCLTQELHYWIEDLEHRKNITWGFLRNLTMPRSYHNGYLDCIGKETVETLITSSESSFQTYNNNSLEWLPYEVLLERGRRYLNGRKIVIATIHRPPFVSLEISDKRITGAKGFCLNMLNYLANKFNFTYRLVLSYDGNWGNPMKNGTFNGMVGMVQRKEVDFAVGGFSITQIRNTVVDFTHPFYDEPSTILMPYPKEKDKLFAFLQPFTFEVWTGILIALVIVSPLMWFFASYCSFLPLLYPFEGKERSSIWKYFLDCSSTLLAQGPTIQDTTPCRLLLGFWLIANVTFIYVYTSTLTAFLTVPLMQRLIESLEELANQKEILWTYVAGTAHQSLFEDTEPPGVYYEIGKLIKEKPDLLVRSNEEGMATVLGKNMAFVKEKSWLDFAMERDYLSTGECRFSQAPETFFSVGFGWPVEENSVYLPLFNSEILRMMQHGLLEKWQRLFWPQPNKCNSGGGRGSQGQKALTLRNFYGHFLILGMGLAAAILSFLLLEKLPNRHWKAIT